MLVLGFLGVLLTFLLLEGLVTGQRASDTKVDNTVLDDQTLAYHLDWDAVRGQKLLRYLYVKKVNAVVRYQNLAGVDYEQARDAIEYLLTHPEILPEIALKRRPAIPEAKNKQLSDLIAAGKLAQATSLYAQLVDVDQFTAQQVVERMEREQYIDGIQDNDVEHLLVADHEADAVAILQKRYGLTQGEAIQAIDAMYQQKIND